MAYELASVSKVFTAVAAAQLVEAGRLRFDAPLAEVLPEYPDSAAARRVTVHHLLTHSSGIMDFFRSPRYWSEAANLRALRDYWPIFAGRPLELEPGTGWAYSNSNFILLGSIVERGSGMPFHRYVEERVFAPAGMRPSIYRAVQDAARPRGYSRTPAGQGPGAPADPDRWHPTAEPAPRDSITGSPAGGGAATARDLARFAEALAAGRLVAPHTLERMLAGYVDAEYGGRDGYGFETRRWNGIRIVGHGGTFPGVSNQLDIYPDLGYTVVILSNLGSSGAQALAYRARLRLASLNSAPP
jgi:CubicO group peptidase (beta-lactamase class C family)